MLLHGRVFPIHEYFGKATPASIIKFKPLNVVRASEFMRNDEDRFLDLNWMASWLLSKKDVQSCNWSGYMQHLYSSNSSSFDKTTILMLPLIL